MRFPSNTRPNLLLIMYFTMKDVTSVLNFFGGRKLQRYQILNL